MPEVLSIMGLPVSDGSDQLDRQFPHGIGADHHSRAYLLDLRTDRGIEVDYPDFTAFGGYRISSQPNLPLLNAAVPCPACNTPQVSQLGQLIRGGVLL